MRRILPDDTEEVPDSEESSLIDLENSFFPENRTGDTMTEPHKSPITTPEDTTTSALRSKDQKGHVALSTAPSDSDSEDVVTSPAAKSRKRRLQQLRSQRKKKARAKAEERKALALEDLQEWVDWDVLEAFVTDGKNLPRVWEHFTSPLLDMLAKSTGTRDLTIVCSVTETFDVHRCLAEANSPVLADMINADDDDLEEPPKSRIIFPFSGPLVKAAVGFWYSGRYDISSFGDNVQTTNRDDALQLDLPVNIHLSMYLMAEALADETLRFATLTNLRMYFYKDPEPHILTEAVWFAYDKNVEPEEMAILKRILIAAALLHDHMWSEDPSYKRIILYVEEFAKDLKEGRRMMERYAQVNHE